jgi:hypothetical protein
MTKRKSPPKITVEELLGSHNPDIQTIVTTLRNLILQTVPNAAESANPGWHSVNYRHPQQGYFCGIFPTQDTVILVFEFGILLPDPDGILEGDGKQVRNIVFHSQDEIAAESIKKLLLEALNLPVSRNEKLELIRSGARPMESVKHE